MSALHRSAHLVDVGGTPVRITTPERVLYPRVGFTKAGMLDYYARVAHVLLPHLAARPASLRRFPEGVEGNTWYQTRCGANHPDFVRTVVLTVPGGEPQDYCVIDDLPGLLWAANLSSIELHPLLMRAPRIEMPTMIVFDLDPGPGAGLLEACEVALLLREALISVDLRSFVKTSGSRGLHVAVPVNLPVSFEATKTFARLVAASLAQVQPGLVVDRQTRELRVGKVLVDWLQNDWRRSTVAPYSLRAGPVPSVSMPLDWMEVDAALAHRDERPLWFPPAAALERVAAVGDLFAEVQTLRQAVPTA